MIAANTLQAELWEIDAATYFADSLHISNSMLSMWRQSRQKYYRRFVAKIDPPKPSTDAMVKGTLLHLLKLEPSRWEEALALRFAKEPETAPDGKKWYKRKGSDHERWWAEWKQANEGKIPYDEKMMQSVRGMAAALLRNPISRQLLEAKGPVPTEQAIRWLDVDSGLNLKCRIDKVLPDMIWDLKSASDVTPRGFSKTVASLSYHRQAAFYTNGWEQLTGERVPFLFVAVGSDAPHEVGVYRLDDEAIELGSNQIRSTLQQLAACYRNDDWLAPWEKRIYRLSLPTWSMYADEWEVIE